MMNKFSTIRHVPHIYRKHQTTPIPLDYFHLFWVFLICSVGGLFFETLFSYPIDGVWKNRAGFVWGPFSPIYGVGGVLMTLVLGRMRHTSSAYIFLLMGFVGAMFEFVAGWFFETAFGIVAWSYIDRPFNLLGYTCLEIGILWGLLGLLWAKVLMSAVYRIIDLIPTQVRKPLTIALSIFIFADTAMTLLSFNFWYERSGGIVPTSDIQLFFNQYFGDEFMEQRFQTISIYSVLAHR